MTYRPELRLRMQLWLHHAWSFRMLAWSRSRISPARDKSMQDVVNRLQDEIARLEAKEAAIKSAKDVGNLTMGKSGPLAVTTLDAAQALMWQDVAQGRIERPDVDINLETKMPPTEEQLAQARAFIADAERTENSIGTRIDAAINSCAALDRRALDDDAIHKYLHLKYAATDEDLTFYYDTALCLAKTLLSKLETK